ncbi:hypothetical protein Tco_0528180 [Tanacetum coccineum]
MMNTRPCKEELTLIPVWVKIHDVLIQVFSEDDISLIVSKIGIGFTKETIRVEYEWKPPRCEQCKIFGHMNDQRPKNATTIPTVINNDGFQRFMSHVRDTYASESYVSSSKQKCIELGGLEVGSGSASLEQHRSVTGRTNARLESVGLGRENADLACDIDVVFGCSVELCWRGRASQSRIRNYQKPFRDLLYSLGPLSTMSEGNIPANADDKCRKSILKLFANETSSLSESTDIAPDMNSCIQSQVTPSESLVDLLCSVVPCSFASDNVVSHNSNHRADLENIDGPIVEPNFDNLERVLPQNADLLTCEGKFISRISVRHPLTISRRAASLKTFSMLPRCDPYLDKEQTHGSFDMGNDCIIRLSWAYVHCPGDVQLTITMFEGTLIERNIDVLTQVCCKDALRKELEECMLACEAILKSHLE